MYIYGCLGSSLGPYINKVCALLLNHIHDPFILSVIQHIHETLAACLVLMGPHPKIMSKTNQVCALWSELFSRETWQAENGLPITDSRGGGGESRLLIDGRTVHA